eukprot:4992135-Alexandrium_andersonii.AAC.1
MNQKGSHSSGAPPSSSSSSAAGRPHAAACVVPTDPGPAKGVAEAMIALADAARPLGGSASSA